MSRTRQNIGQQGEQIARAYLQEQGYQLVTTNFRCKIGEIDIIAKDDDVVVFVEVRTITPGSFGPAYNTVTYSKQRQVKKVALFYISKHNLVNTQFRFDVIGITLHPGSGEHHLDHIPNAFA